MPQPKRSCQMPARSIATTEFRKLARQCLTGTGQHKGPRRAGVAAIWYVPSDARSCSIYCGFAGATSASCGPPGKVRRKDDSFMARACNTGRASTPVRRIRAPAQDARHQVKADEICVFRGGHDF